MQKDIDSFRAEYKKQKKLEKIVATRVLVRPNVKKWQIVFTIGVLPFLLSFAILFILDIETIDAYKIVFICLTVLLIFETYLRFCLILLVKYYQSTAKEETRRRCKCIPSCSEYSILCLKRVFPLIVALLKIRKRLLKTCNGEEYKIDFPLRKMGENFEKSLL